MSETCILELADESATARFGEALAAALPAGFFYMAFQGGLGAGKTHTVRSLLRALGETGAVRSPTYTLLEDYQTASRRLVHMDLYRLADAQELEFLGLRDLLGEDLVLCVEWPARGAGQLPEPDLSLQLTFAGESARRLRLQAGSPEGQACLQTLKLAYAS